MVGEEEEFLANQTRQFMLECVENLSITSFDTYSKDKPQFLMQNTKDDADRTYKADLSMYPMMSNTDDDDDDDDDGENGSCTPCVSDHDHPMPFTFAPSSNHQHHHGAINCCHPTMYSRKQ